MGKKITTNTIRILLFILLIAGVMGYGLYARKHTAETEDPVTCVRHQYAYPGNGYNRDNLLEISYPEIVSLEDKELQEKANTVIRNLAFDEALGRFVESTAIKYFDQGDKWVGTTEEERELSKTKPRRELILEKLGTWSLYGQILSISGHKEKIWNEMLVKDAASAYRTGSEMAGCQHVVDLDSGKELALSDIMNLDASFFDVWNTADFSLYYETKQDAIQAKKDYTDFYRDYHQFHNFEEEPQTWSKFDRNEDEEWYWMLDEDGMLCIKVYGYGNNFRMPISAFRELLKPQYKWLVDQDLTNCGGYPEKEEEEVRLPEMDEREFTSQNLEFCQVSIQYGEDLKLDLIQMDGIQDVYLQRDINDAILSDVLDTVLDDLRYAYMNNQYYSEEEKYERESRVQVNSAIPHYYLNGKILSIINIWEVERKSYTRPDGTIVKPNSKGPCLQAFNIDCRTGKELVFDDVFERNIESSLVDRLVYYYWNDEIENRDAEGTAGAVLEGLYLKDMAEREKENVQTRYYHWYVNGEQKLCFYAYDIQENENQSAKLPLATQKENIKPAYQSCFQFENSDVTEEE